MSRRGFAEFVKSAFGTAVLCAGHELTPHNPFCWSPMDSHMTKNTYSRRELKLDLLEDALSECTRLLDSGYKQAGNWTLGQMCQHLRLTMEANMYGYPRWMTALGMPLRPILRAFALPRLLAGNSISGVRTAGMFVPPAGLDDNEQVRLFEVCVRDFENHAEPLHPHPGFGRMTNEEFNRFHAAHAAHHLSFLIPPPLSNSQETEPAPRPAGESQ